MFERYVEIISKIFKGLGCGRCSLLLTEAVLAAGFGQVVWQTDALSYSRSIVFLGFSLIRV